MNAKTFDLVVNEIAATMDIPVATLRPNTLLAEIGMDSLQALQLLVALEQATNVRLEDEDFKHFTTVQSIVDLLSKRFVRAGAA